MDVNKSLSIIFLGTPQFAVPILETLAQCEYKPSAVFCAPDKPIGRQQILTAPPAKIAAQKYGLDVFQPSVISDFEIMVSDLKPDLIISAAYGLILPKKILDLPRFGCLNIHPSLLPRYRGASPIQAAILNGDRETGVTIIKMDEKIDHGDIIASEKCLVISDKCSTPELSEKLAACGAQLLIKILPDWISGKIEPQAQDDSRATFTKIIKKEDGQIDWTKSAVEIERQIRAYTPWPGTQTGIKNLELRIKISDVELSEIYGKKIGEIFLTPNGDLAAQTGQGSLIIQKIQAEGGKALEAHDFLRGHQNIIGQYFI